MKDLEKRLEDRITVEFDIINNPESSVKEKNDAINRMTSLYKLLNDSHESSAKPGQDNHEGIFQWVKLGVEVFGVTAPLIFYGAWMRRGLKFEETGTLTSGVFKGLIGKFKPTK